MYRLPATPPPRAGDVPSGWMDEKEERIQTLQTLLTQAREREEAFTTRSFKDQTTIADLQSRPAQVDGRLTEAHRELTLLRAQLDASVLESDQMRAASIEMRADLESLAGEASAAVARAQAHDAEVPGDGDGRGIEERTVVDLSEERAANHPGASWHTT